jgi:hypothetical protein
LLRQVFQGPGDGFAPVPGPPLKQNFHGSCVALWWQGG